VRDVCTAKNSVMLGAITELRFRLADSQAICETKRVPSNPGDVLRTMVVMVSSHLSYPPRSMTTMTTDDDTFEISIGRPCAPRFSVLYCDPMTTE